MDNLEKQNTGFYTISTNRWILVLGNLPELLISQQILPELLVATEIVVWELVEDNP